MQGDQYILHPGPGLLERRKAGKPDRRWPGSRALQLLARQPCRPPGRARPLPQGSPPCFIHTCFWLRLVSFPFLCPEKVLVKFRVCRQSPFFALLELPLVCQFSHDSFLVRKLATRSAILRSCRSVHPPAEMRGDWLHCARAALVAAAVGGSACEAGDVASEVQIRKVKLKKLGSR